MMAPSKQDAMARKPAPPVRDEDETVELLARARDGDSAALNVLFSRQIPLLRRWASGRLPQWARDIADTSDLIQETVFETFKRIESFEPRGEGALQAYLRQALVNRLRNQLRRVGSRPDRVELESNIVDDAASPLETAIGRQTLERYEAALEKLKPGERDAIVSRIEFGMTYAEVATALDKPSADAARMAIIRALNRLTEIMAKERDQRQNRGENAEG
jgi:RNA polymerase sigma-70 factor (ECF subfamily)